MRKYSTQIYEDIQEYYFENYHIELSEHEIDNMDKYDVLQAYLEWNGIFGYTNTIYAIMEVE